MIYKKILFILICVFLSVLICSCNKTYEIALITNTNGINDAYSQSAFLGIKSYTDANKKSCKYYIPLENTAEAVSAAIEQAILNKAEIIVVTNNLFEEAEKYNNIKFILIDSDEIPIKNTTVVGFPEHEAGFLAGYAAVKDGYRSLGFIGAMPVPAVVRYGYGFIQGAEYAACEMSLKKDSVNILYHYTGSFNGDSETEILSNEWYKNGAEVIFTCGGTVGNSVMQAAETYNKFVIGADVDQSGVSDSVISSAVKKIEEAVYDALNDYYNGVSGDKLTGNTGLSTETSKWNIFTQEDYDGIYEKLKTGKIEIWGDTRGGEDVTVDMLPVSAISIIISQSENKVH